MKNTHFSLTKIVEESELQERKSSEKIRVNQQPKPNSHTQTERVTITHVCVRKSESENARDKLTVSEDQQESEGIIQLKLIHSSSCPSKPDFISSVKHK